MVSQEWVYIPETEIEEAYTLNIKLYIVFITVSLVWSLEVDSCLTFCKCGCKIKINNLHFSTNNAWLRVKLRARHYYI